MRHFGIKIQKFWEGAQPPPQTPSPLGRGHPLPKPYPPRRLRRLDLAPPRSPTLDFVILKLRGYNRRVIKVLLECMCL